MRMQNIKLKMKIVLTALFISAVQNSKSFLKHKLNHFFNHPPNTKEGWYKIKRVSN